jgi:Holliday junction resolvasome RuvABC ATP-dependent DNA helicase subunit
MTMQKPVSIFIDDDDINDSFISSNSIFKYKQDLTKSINERALIFFSPVVGCDAIKRQLYRAILKEDTGQINILLGGAPATAKTLLMQCILNGCNNVLFYDAASGSTGAGLIEVLRNNQNTKILIIDEIAELSAKDLKVLRGLLNNGSVTKTLKTILINFVIKNLKVFCTTNNLAKINRDKPLRSRFQIYLIPKYNDNEFIQVLSFCLKNQGVIKSDELIKELAYGLLKYGIKNIRIAISICKLVHEEHDKHVDIKGIIKDYLANDGSNCNIDFNVEEV